MHTHEVLLKVEDGDSGWHLTGGALGVMLGHWFKVQFHPAQSLTWMSEAGPPAQLLIHMRWVSRSSHPSRGPTASHHISLFQQREQGSGWIKQCQA